MPVIDKVKKGRLICCLRFPFVTYSCKISFFFFYFCVNLLGLDYKDGRNCVNITCTQIGRQSLPLVSSCMCIVEGQVIYLCLSAFAFCELLFSKVTLLSVPTQQTSVLFSICHVHDIPDVLVSCRSAQLPKQISISSQYQCI